MLINNIMQLKSDFNSNGVLMSFTGFFTQEIIQELGSVLKGGLNSEKFQKSINYDIFSIFVEQVQNITNHLTKKIQEGITDREFMNSGIISIGCKGNKYFICSANYVEENEVRLLTNVLESIKDKNKEELKQMYKEKRKADRSSEGGAGLGFIEMARKSCQPIEYSFVNKTEKYFLFTLNVFVDVSQDIIEKQ